MARAARPLKTAHAQSHIQSRDPAVALVGEEGGGEVRFREIGTPSGTPIWERRNRPGRCLDVPFGVFKIRPKTSS